MRKFYRVRHRSDHRDTKKRVKRVLKIGLFNFFIPDLLVLIIALAHKFLLKLVNLWILRGLTLIIVLWCCVGFFILTGGVLLWLRVKAG